MEETEFNREIFENKETFKREFSRKVATTFGKKVSQASDIEKFLSLADLIRTSSINKWRDTKETVRNAGSKQVFYFSLEFLLGRMLTNNLLSLGVYDVVKEGLADYDIDINALEDVEADAGLGNGGLGRLAACFLESLATLDYPGSGNTIRYKNGLFKQLIINNEQVEVPDQWLRLGNPWEVRKPDKIVNVRFYGDVKVSRDEQGELQFEHTNYENVLAVPYDMPIIGANTSTANTLRMWSAEPSDTLPEGKEYREYISDVEDICLNLYPDDSTENGKMLRIKQEYFFVAAGLASIVRDHMKVYATLDNLAEKNVIQLNDTHPSLAIPELMRILLDEYHMKWAESWNIVKNVFAFTNHTVLPEAIEKWPVSYIEKLLPRIYMIIVEIDRQFKEQLRQMGMNHNFIDSVSIISENYVRMANLSIVGSFSVNGVAKIHSGIIAKETFRDFYKIFPQKFNNKTNGVTPRRWMMYANRELTELIDRYIGTAYHKDFSKIVDLLAYVDNPELQEGFLQVRQIKKQQFADFVYKESGIRMDTDSIFDIQAKRLHAYKRQLLNIMYVISLYQKIKADPDFGMPKTTFIFGAKAASSYFFAKKVIKLINCVSEKIREDERASRFIQVVFVPNYRVTVAEKMIPACDVSEQISTAGKEASGTGNMKFMMNGSFTLGTLDGANVEIADLVGSDNIEIFGLRASEVKKEKETYSAYDYYQNNETIRKVVDSLTDGTFSDDPDDFKVISDEFLLHNDEYMLLRDFESYEKAHKHVYDLYVDKKAWARKCLINIAKSGFFSSDRTIEDYVDGIWKISKLK